MHLARAFLIIIVPLVVVTIIIGRSYPNTQISFSEVFEGYPCDGHCDQFEVGFKTAESNRFTQKSDCKTLSTDSQLGCLSYIHEYTVTHHDQL